MSAGTVVIGAGAAGLWCALHAVRAGRRHGGRAGRRRADGHRVGTGRGRRRRGADDSPERHAADTIAAGAGLCDPAAVDVLVREAPEAVAELRAMGMRFDEGDARRWKGGTRARRVHHAGGDRSGPRAAPVPRRGGRAARRGSCASTRGRSPSRCATASPAGVRIEGGALIAADRVVLATGGACGIYGRRTGPDTSVGEGFALAWHAGAALADLEFVQFHPTALDVPGHPARLLTEALRGEGAVLRDAAGERFMDRFHPLGDLAPRDVVARAVLQVREETGRAGRARRDGGRPTSRRGSRRPTSSAARSGWTSRPTPVPVAPAAHYCMGGRPDRPVGPHDRPGAVRRRRGREHRCPRREPPRVELARGGARLRPASGDRRRRTRARPPAPVDDARDAEPAGAMALAADPRPDADRFLGVRRDGPELDKLAAELVAAADPGGGRAATLVAWLMAHAADAPDREPRRPLPGRLTRRPTPPGRCRQVVDRRGWCDACHPCTRLTPWPTMQRHHRFVVLLRGFAPA